MALVSSTIGSSILSAAPDLTGPVWTRLVSVIGSAVASWATVQANVTVAGVVSGTVGGGTVNGKVSVIPQPLPVAAAMSAAGLLGVNAGRVARAVGAGVANAINSSALYQGTATGVGVGSDVSKVSFTNSTTLVALINQVASGSGLSGPNIARIAVGLGTGIAALVLTGTGLGTVAGAGGPYPSSGTSLSRIV